MSETEIFPGYRTGAMLGGRIGKDGIARTQEVIEIATGKRWVRKRYDLTDPWEKDEFYHEKAAMAILRGSTHVVTGAQVIQTEDAARILFPYITSETLEAAIATSPRRELGESDIVPILRDALEGLAELHGYGIVHRDVKPANILVELGGERAWVIDLGTMYQREDLLRERGKNGYEFLGTPEYAAPEVCACQRPLTPATDIYSLGITLYEMATGAVPFNSVSTMQVLKAQVRDEMPPVFFLNPKIPRWIRDLVRRATQKDPRARFPDAEAMLRVMPRAA